MLFVTFCCAIALVFPQFHLIVALFGSFSNALLAYILPALFWVRICTPDLFYGVLWYPFDRDTTRARPFDETGGIQNELNLQYGTSDESPTATSSSSPRDTSKSSESQPLMLTINTKSDKSVAVGDSGEPFEKATGCVKFSWLLFPYTVALVGSLASVVGVVMAIKDLIDEFGH